MFRASSSASRMVSGVPYGGDRSLRAAAHATFSSLFCIAVVKIDHTFSALRRVCRQQLAQRWASTIVRVSARIGRKHRRTAGSKPVFAMFVFLVACFITHRRGCIAHCCFSLQRGFFAHHHRTVTAHHACCGCVPRCARDRSLRRSWVLLRISHRRTEQQIIISRQRDIAQHPPMHQPAWHHQQHAHLRIISMALICSDSAGGIKAVGLRDVDGVGGWHGGMAASEK